jgi:hypothetical protein
VTFELGNLQRFVVHDRDTYEAYVIDPYEVGVIVPILAAGKELGAVIYCPGVRPEPYVVQECVSVITAAMEQAAPGLAN